MSAERIQNGTLQQHGKEWAMWERSTFRVTLVGFASLEDAERFKESVLGLVPEGVLATAEPITTVEMSEEDQAEVNVLNALVEAGQMN